MRERVRALSLVAAGYSTAAGTGWWLGQWLASNKSADLIVWVALLANWLVIQTLTRLKALR
jgi:hypothetical protein